MRNVWKIISTSLTIEGPAHIKAANLFISFMCWRNTRRYFKAIGRAPNHINPSSYSEKMQCRKLFDRNPFLQLCCDKLASRAYVETANYGIRFPEIYWTGDDVERIPFDTLPVPYIIKPNGRSGANIAVRDRDTVDKSEIRAVCRRWLKSPYGRPNGEWGYLAAPRKIIIEQLLPSETDAPFPDDYKFIVIGGRVEFIMHFRGTRTDNRQTFYDRSWTRLGLRKWNGMKEAGKRDTPNLPLAEKPAQFDRMIEIAEHFGRDVDQVRVDFYSIAGEIYFSELTVYPGSGHHYLFCEDAVFDSSPPHDVDYDQGRNWQLPPVPLSLKLRRAVFG